MTTTFEMQLEQIAQSIFATMMGLDVIRADTPTDDCYVNLLATIQISGESNCSIVMALSETAARLSSSAMLQLPEAEITPADQRDVAAELVNMVGGNLKSLLAGPSFLSLPAVAFGTNVDLEVSGGELAEDLYLACDGGLIRLCRFVAAACGSD